MTLKEVRKLSIEAKFCDVEIYSNPSGLHIEIGENFELFFVGDTVKVEPLVMGTSVVVDNYRGIADVDIIHMGGANHDHRCDCHACKEAIKLLNDCFDAVLKKEKDFKRGKLGLLNTTFKNGKKYFLISLEGESFALKSDLLSDEEKLVLLNNLGKDVLYTETNDEKCPVKITAIA